MSETNEPAESLRPEYVPSTFVDRETPKSVLSQEFSETIPSTHLSVSGPSGTGKTHLIHHAISTASDIHTCYISCARYDTQYKVLKQILAGLLDEAPSSGHHVSELQNRIEERLQHTPSVIVLDDLDFLLLNGEEDLLYFLSRLSDQLRLILLTSESIQLDEVVDQRIMSSLSPREIVFDEYTEEEGYEVLAERAEAALPPRSIQQLALERIVSTTQNIGLGLCWLRTAFEQSEIVTVGTVEETKTAAFRRYIDHRLEPFSEHHRLLLQAVIELSQEGEERRTGTAYNRYQELCDVYSETARSRRKISTLLTELQHLQLLHAEYYRGGAKGKTREIELVHPFNEIDSLLDNSV